MAPGAPGAGCRVPGGRNVWQFVVVALVVKGDDKALQVVKRVFMPVDGAAGVCTNRCDFQLVLGQKFATL